MEVFTDEDCLFDIRTRSRDDHSPDYPRNTYGMARHTLQELDLLTE
jgi:hypothetical protein